MSPLAKNSGNQALGSSPAFLIHDAGDYIPLAREWKIDPKCGSLLHDLGGTVKTLYIVTHYNRIINILHKYAGNGSVSIKIPSL